MKLFQHRSGLIENHLQLLANQVQVLLVLRVIRQLVRADFKAQFHPVFRISFFHLRPFRIPAQVEFIHIQLIIEELQRTLVGTGIQLEYLAEGHTVVILYAEVGITTVVHLRIRHHHRILPVNRHPLLRQRLLHDIRLQRVSFQVISHLPDLRQMKLLSVVHHRAQESHRIIRFTV